MIYDVELCRTKFVDKTAMETYNVKYKRGKKMNEQKFEELLLKNNEYLLEQMDRKIDKDSIEAYKIKAREILSNRTLMEESERWEREIRDSSYIKILED